MSLDLTKNWSKYKYQIIKGVDNSDIVREIVLNINFNSDILKYKILENGLEIKEEDEENKSKSKDINVKIKNNINSFYQLSVLIANCIYSNSYDHFKFFGIDIESFGMVYEIKENILYLHIGFYCKSEILKNKFLIICYDLCIINDIDKRVEYLSSEEVDEIIKYIDELFVINFDKDHELDVSLFEEYIKSDVVLDIETFKSKEISFGDKKVNLINLFESLILNRFVPKKDSDIIYETDDSMDGKYPICSIFAIGLDMMNFNEKDVL